MVLPQWAEKVKSCVFLVNTPKRMISEERFNSGYMRLLRGYRFVSSLSCMSKALVGKVAMEQGVRLHGISNMDF